MMNILLTGSTGFVGSMLRTTLSSHNYKMFLLLRNPVKDLFFEESTFLLPINGSVDYTDVVKDIDCIIHCAARVHIMDDSASDPLGEFREVNTYGTIKLARQAAEAGVKRFIFISSIKVNGESTEIDKPFKSSDSRSVVDYYGQSKAEAEDLLLQLAAETGLEVVIIRPTLVYGPGVKANFASLLNLVSRGFPLPLGCINTNRRSLVSVTNLVDLITTCIEHPKAVNQTFLVSDDHDLSTSEMVAQMARALCKPQLQLPMPKWCFKLAGKLFRKRDVVDRLLGSLQVDISHTKETLCWVPPQSLEAGFKQTAQAFLKSKKK
jgi:UDP-glucose 4-epimerase